MKCKILLSVALAFLIAVMGILPVMAQTATVQLQDTFYISCNVSVTTIDGVAQSRVRTATLICADDTVVSKGVITNATLAVPGYITIAVTGYVGTGSNPYLYLHGDGTDATVSISARVHAHGAVVQYIYGRIDGAGTHSEGALGETGTGTSDWSTADQYSGVNSVKLVAEADPGSQYVQFAPPAGIRIHDLDTITTGWGLEFNQTAVAYGPQMELRFQNPGAPDPDGVGHVDITLLLHQGAGSTAWEGESISSLSTPVIYYGNDPFNGTAFSEASGALVLGGVEASINGQANMGNDGTAYSCSNWVLTRVRVELYEGGVRTCYVDDVEIAGKTYSFEPVVFAGNFKATP